MHTYTGVPASTGIVVGPVEQIDHGTTGLHRIVCDPFRERALYDVAVVLAKDELRRLSQRAKGPDADILLFQIALLEDESFTNEIGDYIAAGAGGAAAVERAEQIFAGRLKNVDDEYIRERSVDVCDVCRRVVDILDGRPRRRLHLKRPSILVADRFFPSDLFSLDRRMVLGLASDQDSTVSHAAIMARSMGIPAVVQLGGGTAAMAVGHRAILDADNGTLIVEPDGAQIAQADCKIALSRLHGQKPDPVAALPCLTKDGTAFRLMPTCNISDNDVPHTRGAAGIGLVRTETAILYDQSDEVQTTRLRELLKSAEGVPVLLRTCDTRDDDDAPWAGETQDRLRGNRLFKPQIKAMLQAAPDGDLRVVFPMITDVSDYRLEKAKECGVDVCVNTKEKNFGEALIEAFGPDKADVIYDCAGNNVTMGQANQYARKGSVIVLVAVFADMATVDLAVANDHELDIKSTMMYRHEDYVGAIELVEAGKVQLKPLISKIFPFAQYLDAYKYIDANRETTMKVIIAVQEK